MPLLASSQTLSSDTLCSVPCYTLKNALIVKAEKELLQDQMLVARDSISILSNIVNTQNDLIVNRDSVISLQLENEVRYKEMLGNKDQIIEVKEKQVRKAKGKALAGWAVAILNGTLLVLKMLP